MTINHRNEEIEKFDVFLFYRFMKKHYGEPSEFEFEELKKTEDGKIAAIKTEWRYFVKTNSKSIILLGTEDKHTRINICHIIPDNGHKIDKTLEKEGKKFIDDLLLEISKNKNQILNPQKEFERNNEIKRYMIFNVYLINYNSAKMMEEFAKTGEKKLQEEFCKFDARTEDSKDKEKMDYTTKHLMCCGMYYASSISYYFMALEGFINLIYHSFIKDELRDELEKNFEVRLDLEQKLILMNSLCKGFKKTAINCKSDILIKYKKLKNYRNKLFHAKCSDALKSIIFYEDGYLYPCNIKNYHDEFIPTNKINLEEIHVQTVQRTIDEIINEILKSLETKAKNRVKKHILEGFLVPFLKDKHGKIKLWDN